MMFDTQGCPLGAIHPHTSTDADLCALTPHRTLEPLSVIGVGVMVGCVVLGKETVRLNQR